MKDVRGYNSYSNHLAKKYKGQRVFKVIVDGGFTCPNRDGSKGYGGCTYCNVDSFTPETARSMPSIKEQMQKGIRQAKENYRADKIIVYFQPNTNTYAPTHFLKMMYDEALSYYTEDIVGLSIGTRPDCIDAEKVKLLESYTDKFDVDIEMGMESIYNETLAQINRGCTHEDLENALALFENSKVEVCVHSIFGFPWETREMMLAYADVVNKYKQIKYVKLHHLHIVEGSIMGVHYKREPFKLFGLEEYAEFLSEFIPRLRDDVIIQRLFGLSDQDMLIAPNWGYKKAVIQSMIDKIIVKNRVEQGSFLKQERS